MYEIHGPVAELRHPWARVKVPPASPWPPRETLDRYALAIDGFTLDLGELDRRCSRSIYEQLPEELRAIWYRFWMLIDGLHTAEQAFGAQDLAMALGALETTPHLASLRDHLRARLRVRPQGFHAIMHWL